MNWVSRLIDALLRRRKLRVNDHELEALIREGHENGRAPMPDNISESFDPFGPSALKRESQNPLLGASYGRYLDQIKANEMIERNKESSGE